MSLFNSMFNQSSFIPDYRDIILFNGYIPYRATGMFKANLIEFEQINEPSTIIHLNTNLSRQQYLDYHNKFEIFRNRDLSDFKNHQYNFSLGTYFPTGRWFLSKYARLWELMKKDDPMEMVYFRDIPYVEDNYIVGKQCSEIALLTNYPNNKSDAVE